jgi:hypothetical protein
MASLFLTPLDLTNFTNTPLSSTANGFVKVYVKNSYLTYLLPSGVENDVVLSRPLDGLAIPTFATGIISSDSLIIALSKLQASLNNIVLTGDVTGTASYISGLLTINATLGTAGYQLISEKGLANGYASLDSMGKVPITQLPSSIMEYKGMWNATTNFPSLTNGLGDTGDVYICNVAGTANFGAGPITFTVGDYVIYSGSIWQRSSGAVGTVTSVGISVTGNAIGVSNSPVTTSGTLALAFAGNSTQYINGAGNLVSFPSIVGQAQNLITEVYNSTGTVLTKGTIVYINGGQGNLPTVTRALATSDPTSAQTYGMVQQDITNMNNGFVVVAGRLSDIDTQVYLAGTQLYLSPTTAGTWTSTKPYAPAHLVYVGIVVRSHPTQGIIEVNIQNGYEMDELHNVSAQNPNNNDILQYKTATNLWTKVAGTTSNIAEGTNLYFTDARGRTAISLTTTGTSGVATYNNLTGILNIPNYATASLTVGTSPISSGTVGRILFEGTGNVLQQSANLFWDQVNSRLSVGAITATARLHVKGDSDTIDSVFRAENLSNTASLEFTSSGAFRWRSSSNLYGLFTRPDFGELIFGPNGFINTDRYITQQFQFGSNLSTTRFDGVQIVNGSGSTVSPTATSGDYRLFSIINNHQNNSAHAFAPTSGTATLTHIAINTDIQQSGTATGRVVGIDYTPVLTSITGAHYGFLIRPATLNGIGLGSTLPTATLHIRGAATSVGNALQVQNLTDTPRLVIGNDGYHAFNTTTVGTTALTVEHPYPTPGNYLIADFKQATTRFTLDTDGRLAWVAGKFATYDNVPNIATISNPAQTTTGIAVSAAGSIKFFSNGREGRIGRKFNYDAGKLYYFAGANGGGFAGTAFHLFESDYGVATSVNIHSQFLQLNPPGITETATAVSSFKFLDIKTSSAIAVTNANATIFGIDYDPTVTTFTGAHYGLLIRPATLSGFGLGATLPTATLHIKGSSDTTGNMFVAENLSNTANLTLANSGVSTFNFSTGGKVVIAGAVGSGETLLEIRRTNSSSGGFIFRSGNALSQELWTTNGNMYLGTPDGSSIFMQPTTGNIIMQTALRNMTAFNSGYQVQIGTQGASVLNRWLNFGHNSSYGQVIQAVQNGSTPAVDTLSLNPFGSNVGIGAILPTASLHIKGDNGFLYVNTFGTRYIRFIPVNDGSEPLDIRTNNTGGNSTQMFIRNAAGSVNLKLSSAAGAGYYLSLGSNLSESPFAYLENGLRNYGALQVQGANNQNVSGHNDFAAVGIIAVGDIGLSAGKQSALSIQSTHTNTSIAANYSLLRLHNNTTFTLTSGGNTVRGLDIDYVINQTAGTTSFIGIDYQPVVTSITGAHYGMLIRPITRNGIGLGSTLPTAQLHIAAGTATANTAPIKLNTGTALTTPEDGALEYHSSHLYFTIGSTRYQLDQQSGGGGGGPETDPVFTSSAAFGITATNISNWNTAYSWGNHATAGYLTSLSVVPVTQGGTNLTSIAAGSILAANTANILSAITSTTGLKILQNNAGTTSWNTSTGTGDSVLNISPTFVTSVIGSVTMAVFDTLSTTVNAFNAARTLTIGSANVGTNGAQSIEIGHSTVGSGIGSSQTISLGGNTSGLNIQNINIGSANNAFTGTIINIGRSITSTVNINTVDGGTTRIGLDSSISSVIELYAKAGLTINVGSDATGDIYYRNSSGLFTRLAIGSANQVLTVTGGLPVWATPAGGGGSGTVTSVSIVTANGFAGTVATNTTTPAITLTTTITGILKGNGTSVSAAVAGTDFQGVSTNLTSLAGLSYASTSFVKMTAAGTFALDTNTYYLASNPNGYTTNVGTVTSVAALTLGTSGTDVSSTVANGTTVPVITLNLPTASAINRGALSSSDWTTFNNKQKVITSGTAAPSGGSDGDIYLQYV